MNRAEYRAAYREARKQARFIMTFHHKLKHTAKRTYPEQCPGFSFTRLSGDPLFWVGGERFRRNKACHRSLLPCLRHVTPRLPA